MEKLAEDYLLVKEDFDIDNKLILDPKRVIFACSITNLLPIEINNNNGKPIIFNRSNSVNSNIRGSWRPSNNNNNNNNNNVKVYQRPSNNGSSNNRGSLNINRGGSSSSGGSSSTSVKSSGNNSSGGRVKN